MVSVLGWGGVVVVRFANFYRLLTMGKGLSIYIIFFWLYHVACRILSHEGLNLCLLQWKHGVLTTGPPGKSSAVHF